MVEDTNMAIEKGEPIYEATFFIDNNLIRADLMNQTKDGWDLYEVKSSSKLKPYHIEDARLSMVCVISDGRTQDE